MARVVAVTFACTLCGATARVDASNVTHLAEAGSRWMASHLEPELVAVETEHGGQVADWVPTGRGRLT
jgi:hypothetical protein